MLKAWALPLLLDLRVYGAGTGGLPIPMPSISSHAVLAVTKMYQQLSLLGSEWPPSNLVTTLPLYCNAQGRGGLSRVH